MQEKHEFQSSASLIVSVVSFITYVCLNDRVCACKVKLQRDLSSMCTAAEAFVCGALNKTFISHVRAAHRASLIHFH